MDYSKKMQCDYCSICILYFENRRCHVTLTTCSEPTKHVSRLTKTLLSKQLVVISSEVISLGYVNYWDRVRDKYKWRFLMHLAGFEIVNQDGTVFNTVDAATWGEEKTRAIHDYSMRCVLPGLEIAHAERARRRRKFLPQQVLRNAILRSSEAERAYAPLEIQIFDVRYMSLTFAGWVNFKNGKIGAYGRQ